MPAVTNLKYDPNDKDLNELADKERKERKERLDRYWKYYDGDHPKSLKVGIDDRDDNVVLNHCGAAIDKEAQFFAPEPPTFELENGIKKEADEKGVIKEIRSAEQKQLDEWLINADFDELITDLALSGFVFGHTFLKLHIESMDDTTPMQPSIENVKLSLIDPRMVTMFWDARNRKKICFFRLQWSSTSAVGQGINYMQDIVPARLLGESGTGWVLIDYVQHPHQTKWTEVEREAWEWDFPPIICWKNGHEPYDCYGCSDLKHYYLNNTINFTASNVAKIIRYHGSPRTFALGFQMPKETDAEGNEYAVDASPDTMLEVPEGGDVKLLEPAANLDSSMNFLHEVTERFYSQMHVIDLSTVKDKLGQITNFGVQMLFSDMLGNIRNKHKVYGKGLTEAVRRALIVMGMNVEKPPVIKWAEPLPIDRLEVAQALQIEVEKLGTSKSSAQIDLGRDPVEESEKRQQDRTERVQDETMIAREQGFSNTSAIGRRKQRENDATLTQGVAKSGAGNGA